jgi:hypothetical protein
LSYRRLAPVSIFEMAEVVPCLQGSEPEESEQPRVAYALTENYVYIYVRCRYSDPNELSTERRIKECHDWEGIYREAAFPKANLVTEITT